MATWVLCNSVLVSGIPQRAGRLVDDANDPLDLIRASGGRLLRLPNQEAANIAAFIRQQQSTGQTDSEAGAPGLFAIAQAHNYANTIIFQPGVPTNGNHVETWDEVADLIEEFGGQCALQIDNRFGQCVATRSVDCRQGVGLFNGTLIVEDGVTLTNLRSIENTAGVEGSPTLAPMLRFTGSFSIFYTREGGTIRMRTGTTTPAVRLEAGTNIFANILNPQFDNSDVPTIPVAQIAPGCVVQSFFVNSFASGPNPHMFGSDDNTAVLFMGSDAQFEILPQDLFTGVYGGTVYTDATKNLGWEFVADLPSLPIPPAAQVGRMVYVVSETKPVWWDGVAFRYSDGTIV